jgi:molybdopterin-dependent oxidoreductase alpha subunit
MGIWEKPPQEFLERLQKEFAFTPPQAHGLDVVQTIRAMREGSVEVLFSMGGNFVGAAPDTLATEAAIRKTALTVSVATKLNRSHAVTGAAALILPALGRTERDQQSSGAQRVSVEDSMSRVHLSEGRLPPASPDLLSEVSIVCRLGEKLVGPHLPWGKFEANYRLIRESIGRVVPGCDGYAAKVEQEDGFVLPHGPRDSRTFTTPDGRAQFTVNHLEVLDLPPGRLLLQTLRSHDQYNTTIYGRDDHYRGVHHGRHVVFVNAHDLKKLGFSHGERVDIVSEWRDGERRAGGFTIISYPTAAGCAAAYFPETNVLVPLDSTADVSGTPTSKSVVVRLEPATVPAR